MNTLTIKNAKIILIQRHRDGKLEPGLKEDVERFPDTFNWDAIDDESVWTENYDKVKRFIETNNKYPSKHSKDKEEQKLGIWCAYQKTKKKKDQLQKDRIYKLEKLQDWEWETNFDDIWNETYNKVKGFKEKNGRYPKYRSKDNEEKKLAIWCAHQRNVKKGKGESRKLKKEQISLLEEIPDWKWETNLDDIWNETYNKVKSFKEKNNKYPSQHSSNKEEKRLGSWCNNQKKSKKCQGNYKITSKRIILLEEIPDWEWETNLDDIWNETYNKVKSFKEKNNKYPSQHSSNKEEKRLGAWITMQKLTYKGLRIRGRKLTKEQISLLGEIPDWKWKKDSDAQWMKNYNLVKEFMEKNKKYPSKHSQNVEEKKLGIWIYCQKQAKKGKGTWKKTKERISLLEQIPNWKW